MGEVKRAKDDGRLPMEDHDTRIIVLGEDAGTPRYVAEALAREPSTMSPTLPAPSNRHGRRFSPDSEKAG